MQISNGKSGQQHLFNRQHQSFQQIEMPLGQHLFYRQDNGVVIKGVFDLVTCKQIISRHTPTDIQNNRLSLTAFMRINPEGGLQAKAVNSQPQVAPSHR